MAAPTTFLRPVLHAWTRRAACVALALGLTGCGLLGGGGSTPEEANYRLRTTDVPARAGGPLPGTVDVASFRADGLLGDRAVLYRKGPTAVAGYNYHFWWASPGAMMQESLIDALRRAKAFDVIATPELRLDRAYEIVGRLRRFEQDGAAVHVEIELLLRATRGGAPLLFKTYTQDVAAADEAVPAVVDAFSTAVGQVWTQFVMDLSAVKPPAPTR